jgi:hypothetical protein
MRYQTAPCPVSAPLPSRGSGIVSGRPQHANLFGSLVRKNCILWLFLTLASEFQVAAIDRKQKGPPCSVCTNSRIWPSRPPAGVAEALPGRSYAWRRAVARATCGYPQVRHRTPLDATSCDRVHTFVKRPPREWGQSLRVVSGDHNGGHRTAKCPRDVHQMTPSRRVNTRSQ